MITSKRVKSIGLIASLAAALALTQGMSSALAAPGDLLATVSLPGAGASVGGSTIPGGPSGIVYINPRSFPSTPTWDIYVPPPGLGPQNAALLATKTFVDSVTGNPVAVSCGTWDPTRNLLWVALTGNPGPVYSVDLGDLTVTGDASATFEFNSEVGGIELCDGIAYDQGRDTLWISPDVDQSVYEYDLGGGFAGFGNQIRVVTPPLNAAEQPDGRVSGVTVGSDDTLYIGRNGAQEIRRINKDTGAFISQFSQTVGRAEDLSCDPVTYAPIEAIISKEFDVFYEAFEVEVGTCPLPRPLVLEARPPFETNELSVDNDHTVFANIVGDGPDDLLINFLVNGQNAGPNGSDFATPDGLEVDFSYRVPQWCSSLGTDTITVSAMIDDVLQSIALRKDWVDTTPPEAICEPTQNPHGKKKPTAPGNGGQGQNQDGFYIIGGTDDLNDGTCAPLQIFLTDNGSGTVFGPFEVGTEIKYTQDEDAIPEQKKIGGGGNSQAIDTDWHIIGNGDAVVTAVDQSGNVSSRVSCLVPPPPK